MNNNFEYYSQENLEGEIYDKLISEKDIMINYVKKNISRKSSLIIASRYEEDFSHNRPLFAGEIAQLHQFFEIEDVYRGKYSGSRHASKKRIKDFPFETNIFDKRYYVYDPHNNLEDYPKK